MIDLANKPESYLKLNEKGSVPTFINSDGSILTESDDSQFLYRIAPQPSTFCTVHHTNSILPALSLPLRASSASTVN